MRAMRVSGLLHKNGNPQPISWATGSKVFYGWMSPGVAACLARTTPAMGVCAAEFT